MQNMFISFPMTENSHSKIISVQSQESYIHISLGISDILFVQFLKYSSLSTPSYDVMTCDTFDLERSFFYVSKYSK